MVDDSDDWVSAREAVRLLKPVAGSEYLAQITIAEHAHDGLIRSRAVRLMLGENQKDNVELMRGFWWARGNPALKANWNTGYFETTHHRGRMDSVECRAYGVEFLRADITKLIPASLAAEQSEVQTSKRRGTKIFIGHGHSDAWRALKDFIVDDLHLPYDEFNRIPVAGNATVARLQEMLDDAAFAFLVLTGEDKLEDRKTLQARLNVVHEAGLFQARLGFEKAIILLEEGCEEFSNIHGLGHIPFPRGSIKSAFHEVRRHLEREGIIPAP